MSLDDIIKDYKELTPEDRRLGVERYLIDMFSKELVKEYNENKVVEEREKIIKKVTGKFEIEEIFAIFNKGFDKKNSQEVMEKLNKIANIQLREKINLGETLNKERIEEMMKYFSFISSLEKDTLDLITFKLPYIEQDFFWWNVCGEHRCRYDISGQELHKYAINVVNGAIRNDTFDNTIVEFLKEVEFVYICEDIKDLIKEIPKGEEDKINKGYLLEVLIEDYEIRTGTPYIEPKPLINEAGEEKAKESETKSNELIWIKKN